MGDMKAKENTHKPLEEVVQSTSCQLNRKRFSGAQSFDVPSRNYVTKKPNLYLTEKRSPRFPSMHGDSNGLSKSMVDLPSRNLNGFRKSVMFEEDIFAHKEMLQRARNRFKELELKYPEIFKDSSRTSSFSSSGSNQPNGSIDRSQSLDPKSVEHQEIQTTKSDILQVLRSGTNDQSSTVVATTSRRRPPPLSVAMKLHNLEDSCDSAFDDIDRESVHSKTSHEPTPTSISKNHFLYPGESMESDKDSGISTDRPCTPNSRSSRPTRWEDPQQSGQQSYPSTRSKSLSLTALPLTNSLEYASFDSESQRSRSVDRRGILKSVAYRNQEIKTESFDIAPSSSNSSLNCQRSRSGSLTEGVRRGSSIYRRNIFLQSRSFSGSQDETDSDAETVCSVQSEYILRPHMSARDRYFSTYQLNTISEGEPRDLIRTQKWRSMPELGRSHSLGNVSFYGDSLAAGFDEDRKKKKKRKFGRRSGLYVVNDMPVSEKPRLSIDKGKSKTKSSSIFLKNKSKKESSHINELTKKWFDSTTAVSRPTGGQSLGRIIAMREDLGSAYVLELHRSSGGLFGFFIQKGYQQYKKGVFVSRIMDCASSKFMAGLLNPGDEILDINGESTASKTMSEVHNILANSDKLVLTVLPFLGRKDW